MPNNPKTFDPYAIPPDAYGADYLARTIMLEAAELIRMPDASFDDVIIADMELTIGQLLKKLKLLRHTQ